MTNQPAVIVERLHKSFGSEVAVDDVSFSIQKGEIFGLLGPNGAGKSTTISIILGVRQPGRGSVTVFGLDSTRDARKIRAMTGYVMQQIAHDKFLTGRENTLLHAELFGLCRTVRVQRAQEVLGWAGLLDAADRVVNTYSGGMMRRLDLAISMLHTPKLVVLDEPTLGLDIETRRRLWSLITRMRDRGVTILLTTHYLEEASQLCDRVAIMHGGKLVGIGSPDALKNSVVGNQHRLRIGFDDTSSLAGIKLPVTPERDNGSLQFSAPPEVLWEILAILQRAAPESIRHVSFHQPSLDDVFLKLTGAEIDA